MFFSSLIFFEGASVSSSLTPKTMTRQLTQKFVRRPSKLQVLQHKDRMRRRSRRRGADIFSKVESVKRTLLESECSGRDLAMAELGNLIFSKGHKHVGTATNVTFVPHGNPAMPLVALAGRGKVGKTALLRSLFRSPKEVGKSNRVLRRDGMNFFNVGSVFNVVDLPGLGGTSVPWSSVLQYASLLRNFSRCQPSLKMLYYCIDVNYKHGLYVQDVDMLRFLSQEIPNFTIILTKGDQINESSRGIEHFRLQDIREELMINGIDHPVLVTSAYTMGGIDTLRFDMVMNCLHALPTERLTYTEAKRLSDRLLSEEEMRLFGDIPTIPTKVDELLVEWNQLKDVEPSSLTTECSVEKNNNSLEASGVTIDAKHAQRVLQRLSNAEHMAYVKETSPWRDPRLWPENVLPTKSLKANIMKCPADPRNPYLFQSHFVAPRADMYFRKPNVGVRRSSSKGRYEPDRPLKSLLKEYTIPYFPDIVDTEMYPSPWVFLSRKEDYYEKSGGRQLGLSLLHHALDGTLNPFHDHPDPYNPSLSHEIKQLEQKKDTAIAMLTPPAD